MYRVVHAFRDREDRMTYYHEGATFPRDGVSVTEERLAYLAGKQNRMQTPLIEKVDPAEAERETKKGRKKR